MKREEVSQPFVEGEFHRDGEAGLVEEEVSVSVPEFPLPDFLEQQDVVRVHSESFVEEGFPRGSERGRKKHSKG